MSIGQIILSCAGATVASAPFWRWLTHRPLEPQSFIFAGLGVLIMAVAATQPKAAPKLALSIVPTLGFMFVFELYLYVTEHGLPRAVVAQEMGIKFDHRSRLNVITDLRAQGMKPVPVAYPITFEKYWSGKGAKATALAPIPDSTTVVCNENGTWMIIRSDSLGFNNPDNRSASGEYSVALLGDSFTYGHCVAPGHDIASHLTTSGLKTANFGIGGTGPLVHLGILKEFVAPKKPKHVVWILYVNDLNDLSKEMKAQGFAKYLDPQYQQDLIKRQNEITPLKRQMVASREAQLGTGGLFAVGGFVNRVVHNIETTITFGRTQVLLRRILPQPKATLEAFNLILDSMQKEISTWDGELLVVLLPDLIDFQIPGDIQNRDLKLIRDATSKAGIRLISTKSGLRAAGSSKAIFPLGVYGHFTSKGYAEVARQIRQAITP